ncbi:hypothetical protein L9F63_016367 [Diploptera punctata]|uniref:Gastrulation defective protein 1 homolog n=1 Tax=Diploptera punctata TaxID=6984 RepID=A0AAD8A2M3_DIPPU|nr:hypothetical protein L9F63_016367 [Diploptera punctata]
MHMKTAADSDSDDDLIGPPVPKKTKSGSDYDSDEGGNERQSDKIPLSEISIINGEKAVIALAADPAGSRMVTGSVDYNVRLWDFGSMDGTFQSFRSLQPCKSTPIKDLKFSMTGDLILIVSGMSHAKIINRDGFQIAECHTAPLNRGSWHPRSREEFLTCAEDSTCRIWNVENLRHHKTIFKTITTHNAATIPTACAYSRDGNTVACGCNDGSIKMWDSRKMFDKTTMLLQEAHKPGTEISCVTFSHLGSLLGTRGESSLKLWDLRLFKNPVHTFENLFCRYPTTNLTFSPDDTMVVSGKSLQRGETTGTMYFFDLKSYEKVKEIEVTDSHVIKTMWHPKLKQILVGCGNGIVKVYYDKVQSMRGAKLCVEKAPRKVNQTEVVTPDQILSVNALPLFRQNKAKSTWKQIQRDRQDPIKSCRPELPIAHGKGGRIAKSGGTLTSHVLHNLGVRIRDDKNPREAILKFAKESAENPYWVSPAYIKTQPLPIFEMGDDYQRKND